jgi:Domain of unknown function (DUF4386)
MADTSLNSSIRVARLAGAMYLVQIATGTFSELVARTPFLVRGDAAQTAQKIMSSEQVFRLGIASDLITYTAVLIATWALFVLLRPINRNVAFLALFFRLIELSIHFNATLNSLSVLRLLSGAEFLRVVDPATLQALAQHALGVQGEGLRMGFIPLGLGSSLFAYLLLKSRFIPRVLAGWGVFASLLLAAFALLIIVYPTAARMLYVPMAPMGIYEIGLGFWLLLRGIKPMTNSVGVEA